MGCVAKLNIYYLCFQINGVLKFCMEIKAEKARRDGEGEKKKSC